MVRVSVANTAAVDHGGCSGCRLGHWLHGGDDDKKKSKRNKGKSKKENRASRKQRRGSYDLLKGTEIRESQCKRHRTLFGGVSELLVTFSFSE